MHVDELILVSIDDHVIEPPGMFDNHVPAKYRDQAPKSITDENGYQKWWCQGVSAGSIALPTLGSAK